MKAQFLNKTIGLRVEMCGEDELHRGFFFIIFRRQWYDPY